jgi:hypothetical protein
VCVVRSRGELHEVSQLRTPVSAVPSAVCDVGSCEAAAEDGEGRGLS